MAKNHLKAKSQNIQDNIIPFPTRHFQAPAQTQAQTQAPTIKLDNGGAALVAINVLERLYKIGKSFSPFEAYELCKEELSNAIGRG